MSAGTGPSVSLPEDRKVDLDGGEQYSDQEGGVEIVDMGDMESLDVMAPRGLPKIPEKKKKIKTKKKVVKKADSSDEEMDAGQLNEHTSPSLLGWTLALTRCSLTLCSETGTERRRDSLDCQLACCR